ncbi:hypothetical protein TB2_033820 [Malus domestica]
MFNNFVNNRLYNLSPEKLEGDGAKTTGNNTSPSGRLIQRDNLSLDFDVQEGVGECIGQEKKRPDSSRGFTGRLAEELSERETEQVVDCLEDLVKLGDLIESLALQINN